MFFLARTTPLKPHQTFEKRRGPAYSAVEDCWKMAVMKHLYASFALFVRRGEMLLFSKHRAVPTFNGSRSRFISQLQAQTLFVQWLTIFVHVNILLPPFHPPPDLLEILEIKLPKI